MTISKQEKAQYRASLFKHLDGIVTAPSAYELHAKGITDYLLEKKSCTLSELTTIFNANEGYLNVALRVLCSQGWLVQEVDNENDSIVFSLSPKSAVAFSHFHLYEDVVALMRFSEKFHFRKFEKEPFTILEGIFKKLKNGYTLLDSDNEETLAIRNDIFKHIEGIILGPTFVRLAMNGLYASQFQTRRVP